MLELKEKELYQEIDIVVDGVKIGTAEVELNSKMLSRLDIGEGCRDKGYGTKVVQMLNEKYGCNCLWVNADNDRAIHVYKKCGYMMDKPTMYLMKRSDAE